MFKRVLLVVSIVLAAVWMTAACSEPAPGEISVAITMKSGGIPPSFYVYLQDSKGADVKAPVVSDSTGICYISNVPPGTYTVVLKDRNKSVVPGGTRQVTLSAGGSERVEFQL
jgi:hypothetical protein